MFGIPSNVLIPIIGIVVLVLLNTPVFSFVKTLFNKKTVIDTSTKPAKEESTIVSSTVETPSVETVPEIYEIVQQWHVLKSMCHKANLGESVKSLDAVFLNLLKRSNLNDKNIS